ncbi:MAG: hypothetical protein R3B47_11460 [Bacteroidia bacterium]
MNLDRNQGQTIKEWEELGLLEKLFEKLAGISSMTVREATSSQTIKQYSKVSFPPKSDFYHPKHVPQGVIWCSVHLQGKECIAGYLEDNIFYIVFLDKDHRFWISTKK